LAGAASPTAHRSGRPTSASIEYSPHKMSSARCKAKALLLAFAVLMAAGTVAVAGSAAASGVAEPGDCADRFRFGAEPVPVAKSSDGHTVLATVSWGYNADANLCYLALDNAAVDALRAAQPVVWWSAGDSYSSGEGTGPENNLAEGSVPFACARSWTTAYGPLAANRLRSHGWNIPFDRESFTACTGARFAAMLDRCQRVDDDLCYGPQSNERIASGRADIVTLTFGGNDIGFGGVMRCVTLVFCELDSTESDTRGAITELRAYAAKQYERIARDYLTPRGKLYVVGYPNIVTPTSEWGFPWLFCATVVSMGEGDMLTRLGGYLNNTLLRAVNEANDKLGAQRVHYLDTAALYRAGKHELCGDGEDWLNGVSWQINDSFHPNSAGHRAVANALADEVLRTFQH